ncbi:MAG TPA: protelomerase family protein [Kamptonema sp.]|nr:protelomerase family protein [Kamptonema sp.]
MQTKEKIGDVLERRAESLYLAVKDLYDEEKIRELCEAEFRWLTEEKEKPYNHNSLGTVLSKHYNRYFTSILLKDGNSFYDDSHEGSTPKKRHLFFKYCGFSNDKWVDRKALSSRVKRVEDAQPIEVKKYQEKCAELLLSEDTYELGTGLIAATGCRPIEILLTGKFNFVPDEEYKIKLSGQAKKQGKNPTFERPVLFPASFLIKALNRFRKSPEILDLKAKAEKILASLKEDEVDGIDAKLREQISASRNRLLWERTTKAFDGIIPPRSGDEYVNNQCLRAAFGAIVVRRDCKDKSDAYRMIYFAKAVGHIAKDEAVTENDLVNIATTIGYGSYYIPDGIAVDFFPSPAIEKEKVGTVRTYASDIERVKAYQVKYGFDNQQEVVRKALDALYDLMENPKKLVSESKDEDMPAADTTVEKPTEKDFSALPSDELKGKKTPGTATEKLDRAVGAIIHHNDYVATSNDDRWQINLSSLRQLSGVRFEAVRKYLEEKQGMIADHNAKYELGDYHNQKLGRRGLKIENEITW